VNTHDRASVMTALNRVLERVGRPRRIGLVVPDVVGKVSLVKFERVPASVADLDQLVRWQVRKTAPFPIEEAQVSYMPGMMTPEGQEFIVSLARRTVVEEYEALCAEAGAHAGLVDLATFNVINAVLAAPNVPAADWLLVNVASDSASIAIMRGANLIFFRNRTSDTGGTLAGGTLADLVHQTEMYYEDRLKGDGFARVILAGAASHAADEVRRSLQERLARTVETIDPRNAAALTDRISATPAFLETIAPLVGMLLRDAQMVQG
jgi:Type IV pilus assembly protein PilM